MNARARFATGPSRRWEPDPADPFRIGRDGDPLRIVLEDAVGRPERAEGGADDAPGGLKLPVGMTPISGAGGAQDAASGASADAAGGGPAPFAGRTAAGSGSASAAKPPAAKPPGAGANAAGANPAGAADAPGPHGGLGHNSGLTREAALDALREHARETGMDYGAYLKAQHRIRETYPDEAAADGVQVAAAPGAALPWLIGALGLGAGIGVLPGPQIPDGDGAADSPSSPPPSAPSGDDADGAAPGFPAGAGGLRDGPPATGDPPAGFDSPPASPDQSGDLPQGTLLPSQDDLFGKGPTFDKIRKAIDAFHANAKPGDLDPPGAARGGRLAPAESPVLKAIRKNGGESYKDQKGAYIVRGKGKADTRIYVYDWGGGGRHQPEIEVFNGKGEHLGTLDPMTGGQIKGPKEGRSIDVSDARTDRPDRRTV